MTERRSGRPRSRWMRAAYYFFLAAGIGGLGYWAATWIGAQVYQVRQAKEFARELRTNPPAPPSPPGPPRKVPAEGGLVGKLEIPRLGLSVMVVEGVGERDLRRALGHIPGTAIPGQPGNVAIAGHRDTFFRPLRLIRPDDKITVRTLTGLYRYRVVSTKIVAPDDVAVLNPVGRDTLTLVTCYPFYYIGAAPKRFIVRADKTQEVQVSDARQP